MFLLMLLLSLFLGLLSVAGIAWIIVVGSIFSVDGLFMGLILLTLAGIFFLNVLLECRDCGFFGKSKAASSKSASVAKTE